LHKIAAENLLILYIDKIAVRGERLRTATLKKIVVLFGYSKGRQLVGSGGGVNSQLQGASKILGLLTRHSSA